MKRFELCYDVKELDLAGLWGLPGAIWLRSGRSARKGVGVRLSSSALFSDVRLFERGF